jgi:hypothetical protein
MPVENSDAQKVQLQYHQQVSNERLPNMANPMARHEVLL